MDLEVVGKHLERSRRANHWTNFGPVAADFERAVATFVDLDPGLRVVGCANATLALHALAEMYATRAGRDLRWAVCSFGYYSTVDGPLRSSIAIDCDEGAMLDLALIEPDEIDGLIVTNIFGQARELEAYRAFARRHDKILLVDAAVALGSHPHGPDEAISFHHTKPWGFGEGGCAIVSAEDEELFRSLIIFGHAPGTKINRRATNGKLSDPSAAFLLMRIAQMRRLGVAYREQYERMLALGRRAGLTPVPGGESHAGIPASVPLLLPAPGPFEHPLLPSRRYYHPLSDDTPQAWSIYRRIVNVPCHAEMRFVSDEDVSTALNELVAQSA
ncbi:MAG: DegT/DnrJ/EryC1/StrS family aminotransferase [Myxococcota bacterium]